MPELPEVETVARGLEKALCRDSVKSVKILRVDSVACPSPAQFEKAIKGRQFKRFFRRGKYILVDFEDDSGMVCHLRMSGRLLVKEKHSKPGRFLRVKFLLQSGRELHFEDMRVFGRLWFKEAEQSFEEIVPGLLSLGIEPLENALGKHMQKAFAGKTQTIKSALLDQRILAGVGNIYADEALFLSGINPQTKAGAVSSRKIESLGESVRTVLLAGIESGGSTLRDYVSAEGVNGNYQNEAWVYGRFKEPCRRCGHAIERVKLAGRSSHFCPKCQPRK